MAHPRLYALLALAVFAHETAPAFAQFDGTLTFDLRIPNNPNMPASGDTTSANEQDEIEFFNLAACECNATFFVETTASNPDMNMESQLDIYLGPSCGTQENRDEPNDICIQRSLGLVQVADLRDREPLQFNAGELMRVPDTQNVGARICPFNRDIAHSIWFLNQSQVGVDQTGNPVLEITADAFAPPLPENISLSGGEGSISIDWDLPNARVQDIAHFQVLCARVDGTAETFATDRAEYITPLQLCNNPNSPAPAQLPGSAPLPPQLATLDPSAICATGGPTAGGIRVEGLVNGALYRIVLVVTDEARNVTPLDLGEIAPTPSIDFWELYRAGGGSAEGGCGAKDVSGLGLALLALLWCARRRRFTAALVLALALSSTAHAQSYWDDEDDIRVSGNDAPKDARPNWNIEIKGGPYLPDVDGEFPTEPGPFEIVFGKRKAIMSKVTLDYFFAYPLGQLGASVSVGFAQRSGNALASSPAGQPIPNGMGGFLRAGGDRTKFRMLPMALGVVYRFTALDDHARIPLVPYGRFNIAYYGWRVSKGNGDLARASTDPNCNVNSAGAMCPTTKGRGASLGYEASVGLALRAERIDADAEAALRNELGIEHAGVFFEVLYAEVDGFGSSSKLSLGDLTWLTGINFEF